MSIVGQRIKLARKRKQLSQTDLANLLGVSQPTIGYWENGHHEPRHANMYRIADALNVRRLWLISGQENQAVDTNNAPAITDETDPYLATPILHIPLLPWPSDADQFLKSPSQPIRHLSASVSALQPFALACPDDAMQYEIAMGSLVVFDAARGQLYDGALYLFNWHGSSILRRWRTGPNRIEPAGDTVKYPILFPKEPPVVIARAILTIRELA